MQSVILGTAQWGLDYGATNSSGRLSDETVMGLISRARDTGISSLDTAPGYGDSESRIGLQAGSFSVQTKVSARGYGSASVRASLERSLARLDRDSVTAVLVHDWSIIDRGERARVASDLEQIRSAGLTTHIGVSGYTSADVASALDAFEHPDIVQLPVNVLDQRLEGSDEISELRNRGGRVQARSIFLQGAALAQPTHPGFGSHPDVARLRDLGAPLDLCIGYVASRPWVDEVVIGVTSPDELTQIMTSWASPTTDIQWPDLASQDSWLLDPRNWTEGTRRG